MHGDFHCTYMTIVRSLSWEDKETSLSRRGPDFWQAVTAAETSVKFSSSGNPPGISRSFEICVGSGGETLNGGRDMRVSMQWYTCREPLNCEKTNKPTHRNLLAVLLDIVVLLIWSLGKQSRQILIKIYRFWHKMSAKWKLFCLVLNVLTAMFSVMSQCHLIFRHAGQTGEGCGASGLGQGTGLVRKEGRVWYSGEHTQGSFWACYMYVAWQFIARAQTLVEFVRMFVIKMFLHRCNYFCMPSSFSLCNWTCVSPAFLGSSRWRSFWQSWWRHHHCYKRHRNLQCWPCGCELQPVWPVWLPGGLSHYVTWKSSPGQGQLG